MVQTQLAVQRSDRERSPTPNTGSQNQKTGPKIQIRPTGMLKRASVCSQRAIGAAKCPSFSQPRSEIELNCRDSVRFGDCEMCNRLCTSRCEGDEGAESPLLIGARGHPFAGSFIVLGDIATPRRSRGRLKSARRARSPMLNN